MIILPLEAEHEPTPLAAHVARPAHPQTTLRLMVYGFSPAERELILGVVALTQRRAVRLELTPSGAAATADVIVLDGADARVLAWATSSSMPTGKTVIQVDGRSAPAGTIHLHRPIQWPQLPALLQQAMDPLSPISTRQPLASTY